MKMRDSLPIAKLYFVEAYSFVIELQFTCILLLFLFIYFGI